MLYASLVITGLDVVLYFLVFTKKDDILLLAMKLPFNGFRILRAEAVFWQKDLLV